MEDLVRTAAMTPLSLNELRAAYSGRRVLVRAGSVLWGGGRSRLWVAGWLATSGRFSPSMLLLAALTVGLLLAPLIFFRFQRDQAAFAYLALLWIDGRLPYAEAFTQQFPGQVMLDVATFKLLGTSEVAVRVVDLLLQLGASLSLACIVARLTRPLTGFLAAILYAMHYICLDPWHTSNRETYQIALLLPVVFWLLFSTWGPRLDRFAAFIAGAVVMFALLIKPTTGLVLPPLLWAMVSPGTEPKPPNGRRRRLLLALLGGFLVAALCGGLFAGHLAAAYESLVTYNVEIYSKLPPGTTRYQIWWSFFFQGLFLAPFVLLVSGAEPRQTLLPLLAVHAALIAAVIVQGRAFPYQMWLGVPFCLLWNTLFIDFLAVRAFAGRRATHVPGLAAAAYAGLRKSCAGAAVLCLALCFPLDNLATVNNYANYVRARTNQSYAAGPIAPIWDNAVAWIREHVKPGERVFLFGHDVGVQFLARIPPISMVLGGILDLRNEELNEHPLIARLKSRLMMDLERDPPEWILVATYDETWISKSGIDSLPAFKAFKDFLLQRYEVVHFNLASYKILRRR